MSKNIGLEHSIRNIISKKENVSEGILNTLGKGLSKAGSKFVPGLGTAVGAADTATRAATGDKTGAAISGIGTAASVVPGIGTAVSVGADLVNMARDVTGLSNTKKDDDKGEPEDDTPSSDSNSTSSNSVKVSADSTTAPAKKTKPIKEDGNKKAQFKHRVIDEGFLLETLKKKLRREPPALDGEPEATKVIIKPKTKEYKEGSD